MIFVWLERTGQSVHSGSPDISFGLDVVKFILSYSQCHLEWKLSAKNGKLPKVVVSRNWKLLAIIVNCQNW